MATLPERQYISTFAGLKSTAITAGSFIVIGFTLHEVLKRLRRYPDEDRRRKNGEQGIRDRGVEGWAMGYLYRARSFVPYLPTPDFSTTPLAFIWTTSFKLPEKFYETHAGTDATTYLRFLRGMFYWTALLTCTVFPIVISINFIESDTKISTASIDRASLSSLITAPNGTRNLWVHVIMIWFMTFSWFSVLGWIGYGAVRMRRNNLRRILRTDVEGHNKEGEEMNAHSGKYEERRPIDLHDERPIGWRWRTILMRNIPPALRSEAAITEYFETYLIGDKASIAGSEESIDKDGRKKDEKKGLGPDAFEMSDRRNASSRTKVITNIILVRKQNELNELFVKYRATQHELESAHTELAQNVMKFVGAKVEEQTRMEQGRPKKSRKPSRSTLMFWKTKEPIDVDLETIARAGDDKIVAALRKFLVDPDRPLSEQADPTTLWIELNALHASDSLLLDRFQPLIKLKHFRGQKIPAIDYWLAKLNLLTRLIEDMRANPEQFEVASSAFVTFERATDARRARTELKRRATGKRWGHKVFECKIKGAPEVRDLDWNRLVLVSLSSDIFRGVLLQSAIWAITIVWVIPVSFVVGLLSLSSISKYIPKLATFLEGNTVTQSLFQSLLPTSIVALLGMLVPTLIGIVTRNGQALITTTKVHAVVQARYWKWSVLNLILVFCIGLSAFDAFLNAFKSPGSVLTVIAEAFPKGATFFVSWTLLVVGIHHGIEISLLGIPWINHASIRKYKAPRKRWLMNEPRFFNYAYWLPNHLVVFAVTTIFACLNPLVIAFNMFYQLFELIVFKNEIAHVYWRRWYENGGRFIYRRLFRYSLDIFLISQTILMAFMFVAKKPKYGGAIIPLLPVTVFVKLIGTRWYDALLNELDEAEIDIVCHEGNEIVEDMSVPLTEYDHDMHHLTVREVAGTIKTFATTTLPALALRPHEKLPVIPSPAEKATHFRSRTGSVATSANRSRANSNVPAPENRSALMPTKALESSADETQQPVASSFPSNSDSKRSQVSDSFNLQAFARGGEAHGDLGTDETVHPSKLITRHAPIVRDDRPVTNVRYDNPAQVAALERSLWLPGNALLPVDLGDTIDYHGRALVSSEGGNGLIGTWDDEHEVDEVAVQVDSTSEDGVRRITSAGASSGTDHPKLSLLDRSQTRGSTQSKSRPILSGNERIRVASDVAVRIESEGGAAPATEETNISRRRSSTASTRSGLAMPAMLRRGTGSSNGSGAAVFTAEPEHTSEFGELGEGVAGVQRRNEHPRPGPPRIPSFSSSTGRNSSPEVETSPERRRPSDLSQASLTVPDRSNLRLPGPRSPRHTTTRGNRAASVALSAMSIAEEDETGSIVVSQAAALRDELLEEERKEHQQRREKEKKRKEKEEEDKRAGWFARTLLKWGVEGDPKET